MCPDINPIIPGFAPDPTVVLIQGTYFIATSSFHLFPGIPIFASKDLATWTHVGNAINRPSQLSLRRSSTRIKPPDALSDETLFATGGLYAPTIRHHKGVTYVVCTNVLHEEPDQTKMQNFVVSTRDIWSDNWSDPVYFDFVGIDPSLFWDDDDRVYVQGSNWTDGIKITCMEIDIDTGATLQPEKTIWHGFTRVIPEGPHVYKRDDGYYYLLVSEGGTAQNHSLAIARSKSIWGPYESCDQNPILKPAKDKQSVQHTGHGDFFQDEQGNWWMACLGVRKSGGGRCHFGRESFLTKVRWPQGGWPSIEPVQPNPEWQETLLRREHKEALVSFQADPKVDLVYIRDPDLQSFSIAPNGRDLDIFPSTADLMDADQPVSFVGRRQRRMDGQAHVRLLFQGTSSRGACGVRTGFALYKDEHRFGKVYWDESTSAVVFQVVNAAKAIARTAKFPVDRGSRPDRRGLTFKIVYSSEILEFRAQLDGEAEFCAGTVDTLDLTAFDFVGPVIGVFSVCDRACRNPDRFEGFVIDEVSERSSKQ